MLFNSYELIFLFFPVFLIILLSLSNKSYLVKVSLLAVSSLIFYAFLGFNFIAIFVLSIVFNFAFGYLLSVLSYSDRAIIRKIIFIISILFNIVLLLYFKYDSLIFGLLTNGFNLNYNSANDHIPIGISFYTFTQIAFLVDVYNKNAHDRNFLSYSAFVSYFPHLISGPIIHHAQIIPQFRGGDFGVFCSKRWTIGSTIFVIGLAKKVLLADNLSILSDQVFAASDLSTFSLIDAWLGAVYYTFQLYFDFSAYTDMAIGASTIIGITLPDNFLSPYKSRDIITFWRTWHITLSTFLRNYIYIPLGGNRNGNFRRFTNLAATMLIGGIWHGANITFLVWGALHAFYLIVNHGWNAVSSRLRFRDVSAFSRTVLSFCAVGLTFAMVVIAWVFFRADTLAEALEITQRMFGLAGSDLGLTTRFGYVLSQTEQSTVFLDLIRWTGPVDFQLLGLSAFIVFLMPNTAQIANRLQNRLDSKTQHVNLDVVGVAAIGALGLAFVLSLLSFRADSPFLYFQF